MFISIQLVIYPSLRNRVITHIILFIHCCFSIALMIFSSWIPPVIIFTKYFEKHIPLPRFLGIIWNMGEVPLPENFLEQQYYKTGFRPGSLSKSLGRLNIHRFTSTCCDFSGLTCSTFLLFFPYVLLYFTYHKAQN